MGYRYRYNTGMHHGPRPSAQLTVDGHGSAAQQTAAEMRVHNTLHGIPTTPITGT